MSKYTTWGDYLVKVMIDNRFMRNQIEIDRYIFALDRIILWKSTHRNPDLLDMLFYCFEDETEQISPMQGLVTYIEKHDVGILVTALFHVPMDLIDRASWWLEHFYAHLLNTSEHRTIMAQKYIQLNDTDKAKVEVMLNRAFEWTELEEGQITERGAQFQYITGRLPSNT